MAEIIRGKPIYGTEPYPDFMRSGAVYSPQIILCLLRYNMVTKEEKTSMTTTNLQLIKAIPTKRHFETISSMVDAQPIPESILPNKPAHKVINTNIRRAEDFTSEVILCLKETPNDTWVSSVPIDRANLTLVQFLQTTSIAQGITLLPSKRTIEKNTLALDAAEMFKEGEPLSSMTHYSITATFAMHGPRASYFEQFYKMFDLEPNINTSYYTHKIDGYSLKIKSDLDLLIAHVICLTTKLAPKVVMTPKNNKEAD